MLKYFIDVNDKKCKPADGRLYWIIMVKGRVRWFTSGKKTKIFYTSRKKNVLKYIEISS